MRIKWLKATVFVLAVASATCLCAQDAVFDQPAVEAKVNVPDLAQRINVVVEGEVTAVNGRAGVFSVSGRRVPFVSSYPEQANPPAELATPPEPLVYFPKVVPVSPCERGACPGGCPTGNCPTGNCPSGNCPAGNCPTGNCPGGVCPTPSDTAVTGPIETSYSPDLSDETGLAPEPDSFRPIETSAAAVDIIPGVGIPAWWLRGGWAEDITNGCGGAYRPFAFGAMDTTGSRSFDEPRQVPERLYVPSAPGIPSDLASTLPPHVAKPACSCTRIIVQAPSGGNGGGAAPEIRPSRQPAPVLNHKFFPPDEGITMITSADLDQPTSLQKDNVLHPVDYPAHAERSWDTACNCEATIVIRPYTDAFTDAADSYTMPRGTVGENVSYEKEPIEDPLPPEHPNDTIFNVKSVPLATAKDLHVGDKVLIGYSSGIVEVPQFVIKAAGAPHK